MDKIEIFKKYIQECNRIVFFTGAGVSTSSGIPDFRGQNGLYKHAPEEILSHDYFIRYPEKFYEFYFKHMVFPSAKPNAAHIGMAKLEKEGKSLGVITQNIDTLHQQAGSTTIPLHGTIEKYFCQTCGKIHYFDEIEKNCIPKCKNCGGILKPDVVLYDEPLNLEAINQAIDMISSCDMLVICGTSLKVYPAASYIKFFKGKYMVLINLDDTTYDFMCDLVIHDCVESVFEAIVTKK